MSNRWRKKINYFSRSAPVPLTDPIRAPLTEIESWIRGLAPTFAPQLPGIQTNKTLLYQTPGSSENSEPPNLIEPASEPVSEFSRTEADTFIINKASDINSIPSANTSPLITNSTLRDTTNSEFDPLIGKLDSGASHFGKYIKLKVDRWDKHSEEQG